MTDHDPAAPGPGHDPEHRARGPWTRLDDGLDRLGLRTPFARDCLLAAVIVVASTGMLSAYVSILAEEDGIRLPAGATALLAVAMYTQSLALCVRRSRPELCLTVVVLAHLLAVALVPPHTMAQSLAPFIVGYTCGALLPQRRLLRVLAAVTAVIAVVGTLVSGTLLDAFSGPAAARVAQPWDPAENLLLAGAIAGSALFCYAVPALVGVYRATRRRNAELTLAASAAAVQRQRERAEGAVLAERARMARELHDIAAHHLSGMVVQLGAAERLIGRDDDAAREATAWARGQGKETLDSLRLVVGALRDPGEAAAAGDGLAHTGDPGARGAPVPGAAGLDRLVQAERALGAAVDLVREGDPYDLPPVADVTVYRVAQEALSNARDHAPNAPVRLLLHYRAARVVLLVENGAGNGRPDTETTSAGAPRGLGLLGMRERAHLVGAELAAAPTDAGGWRVRLDIPVAREPAPGADPTAGTTKEAQ